MVRCSNKSVAEILSSTGGNDNDMILLDRKITMATEGFTTDRFCQLVLKDRSRLSKENALTICDYVIAMKTEVNPRPSYKKNTIQFLSELSRAVGIEKKFIDMTRDDILCYLDSPTLQSQMKIKKRLRVCLPNHLIHIYAAIVPLQKNQLS
jgi:hypothetical protein